MLGARHGRLRAEHTVRTLHTVPGCSWHRPPAPVMRGLMCLTSPSPCTDAMLAAWVPHPPPSKTPGSQRMIDSGGTWLTSQTLLLPLLRSRKTYIRLKNILGIRTLGATRESREISGGYLAECGWEVRCVRLRTRICGVNGREDVKLTTSEAYCAPTSVSPCPAIPQCYTVLRAPSRTVGFTRREFHVLSSIHTTNPRPQSYAPYFPCVIPITFRHRLECAFFSTAPRSGISIGQEAAMPAGVAFVSEIASFPVTNAPATFQLSFLFDESFPVVRHTRTRPVTHYTSRKVKSFLLIYKHDERYFWVALGGPARRGHVAVIGQHKRGTKFPVAQNPNNFCMRDMLQTLPLQARFHRRCAERKNAPEYKGGENRRFPRKPAGQWHRQARFPYAKNPGVTQPGIESSSPWWEASSLTTHPPRPLRANGNVHISHMQRSRFGHAGNRIRFVVVHGGELPGLYTSKASPRLEETKDEVDRSRWLRTTNLRVPTLNCSPANTSSENAVVWISAGRGGAGRVAVMTDLRAPSGSRHVGRNKGRSSFPDLRTSAHPAIDAFHRSFITGVPLSARPVALAPWDMCVTEPGNESIQTTGPLLKDSLRMRSSQTLAKPWKHIGASFFFKGRKNAIRPLRELEPGIALNSSATRRVAIQPIRALTLASSVKNVARATNIGFDARRQRRGVRRITFLISDGNTICVTSGQHQNIARRWRRESDAKRRSIDRDEVRNHLASNPRSCRDPPSNMAVVLTRLPPAGLFPYPAARLGATATTCPHLPCRQPVRLRYVAAIPHNTSREKHNVGLYSSKTKSKYINRTRLERDSQKQSSDTHKTPYDRLKRCRERKINIKASERVNTFRPKCVHDLETAASGKTNEGVWEDRSWDSLEFVELYVGKCDLGLCCAGGRQGDRVSASIDTVGIPYTSTLTQLGGCEPGFRLHRRVVASRRTTGRRISPFRERTASRLPLIACHRSRQDTCTTQACILRICGLRKATAAGITVISEHVFQLPYSAVRNTVRVNIMESMDGQWEYDMNRSKRGAIEAGYYISCSKEEDDVFNGCNTGENGDVPAHPDWPVAREAACYRSASRALEACRTTSDKLEGREAEVRGTDKPPESRRQERKGATRMRNGCSNRGKRKTSAVRSADPVTGHKQKMMTMIRTERGSAVVIHWTRIREYPGSIPCPAILISVFYGFPKSLQANAEMGP
ncbi:hypothetical protein PR048_019330 [Dryococelus australis]|uniref:Uncharacterized protein n=1 Tax=Dryococelus australis TaxID=614101 RepID=A0ABQ9H373_9NEOP|nr:hypothetical protein PR048_019330 [Dryococelus australis]